MPGANNGTGYPLTLRCAKCKVLREVYNRTGTNLEATGRRRKLRESATVMRVGYRSLDHQLQYRCLDCKHVGWTKHYQAKDLPVVA